MSNKGNDIDWKALGLSTDEELRSIDAMIDKVEEEGKKNILKYFDRMHDKVFRFNNILIAGYFFLAKFEEKVSFYTILIPLLNLCLIIYIDYRMMEKSRFESDITNKKEKERHTWKKSIDKTNNYSLFIMSTTLIVTGIFLFKLFKFN